MIHKFLKSFLVALLCLCGWLDGISQFDYKRTSLTVIVVNNPKESGNDLITKNVISKIEDKYNNHNIDVRYITLPEGTPYADEERSRAIKKVLVDEKITNKVLLKWFADDTSKFNWNLVEDRGLYNAKYFDFNMVDRTIRGEAIIRDMGAELIEKTYILVLDFRNRVSMDGASDAAFDALSKLDRRFSGLKKNVNLYGYKSQCFAYLYQLDWSKKASGDFFDAWDNREKVMNLEVDVKYKSAQSFDAFGTETTINGGKRKSDEYYMNLLQSYALERALYKYIKKYDDFAVKAIVVPTPDPKKNTKMKPGAYIGRKENLKIDKRYYAYIRVERKNGTSFYRRKACLRPDRVIDNRTFRENSGNTSRFYYDSGLSVRNGSLIKESPDAGIGLSGYVANADLGHWGVRMDYNLSQFTYTWIPQFRMNLLYSQALQDSLVLFKTATTHWYGIGISREFHPLWNIKTEPHISYLWTKFTYRENDNHTPLNIDNTSAGWEVGCRFFLNVAPSSRIFVDLSRKSSGFTSYGINTHYNCISAGFRYAF